MRRCTFDGCDRQHTAKGLCASHYPQQRQGKSLTPLPPYRPRPRPRPARVKAATSQPAVPTPRFVRDLTLPLRGQTWATLRLEVPLTLENFFSLASCLAVMKPGLIDEQERKLQEQADVLDMRIYRARHEGNDDLVRQYRGEREALLQEHGSEYHICAEYADQDEAAIVETGRALDPEVAAQHLHLIHDRWEQEPTAPRPDRLRLDWQGRYSLTWIEGPPRCFEASVANTAEIQGDPA